MSDELVTMRRGKAADEDIAVVRPEWVKEWKSYGYKVVGGAAESEPSEPSDPSAPSEPTPPQ